jgi:hypothetical protein
VTESVRCWLVVRGYTDKGLVTRVCATPGGDRKLVEQRAANRLRDVTAARDVEADHLDPTEPDEAARYASEAARMAERHDPDDAV